MIKLGIAGAHGVGKSTLQKHLGEAIGPSASFVPDFGRICPLPTGLGTTPEAQSWILLNQLKAEAADQGHEVRIYDNVSIAHYAYYRRRCGSDHELENLAAVSSKTFDMLIYLPPTPGFLVDDGLRPTDVAFQSSVYAEQLELLMKHQIAHYVPAPTWPQWSHATWLATIESRIARPDRLAHNRHGKRIN